MTGTRSRRDDDGAASVLVVALTGLLVLIGMASAFLVATVAAHRRVQSAADLAALAGATTAQPGRAVSSLPGDVIAGDPCEAAARIAAGNGARLTSCRVLASDVLVTTVLDGPRFLGQSWQLRGQARAGPGGSG
ncbi:Rv3654c family TadE-like protein [Nocardioides cavernaquae]|uniref:Uncharacterized protein n=1 Tax=Nocardioides cavernaquae TaxID=2321396 RepID=A0A3A5H7U9_9ACTN|nr:Rv3654c family TadE-like protein [Nocardioides cavernaquae]RJS46051.1 hypothetical protein D4739_07345 [Nocardioides cavernaquae]